MSRIVKKFSELSYIKSVAFPGRTDTVIYLQNYLSTMFNISDVAVDKEEVALALNIKINTADTDTILIETTIDDEQIIIPNNKISVPFSYLSPQEPQFTDDVIESVRKHCRDVSRRTFYRYRNDAINHLSSVLWGYTSHECMDLVDLFAVEGEK